MWSATIQGARTCVCGEGVSVINVSVEMTYVGCSDWNSSSIRFVDFMWSNRTCFFLRYFHAKKPKMTFKIIVFVLSCVI
jgi:hypothetical protein